MSGVKVGLEVVPPTFTGIPPLPAPKPLVSSPPTPLRFATRLKSRLLVGLTVPAPVTVPSEETTRLILSRRVPSGA